jgi:HD-like signal output (HDOD) protein
MTTEHQALLDQIIEAIDNDTLVLPTLPDVAFKIQDLIDDPNVSADQIVQVLSGDPLISAQLIKSANSAAFADKAPVENVRGAITRLGYRQLRNLVMTITMNKMFYAKNPIINKYMKAVWKHSREVAAVSYVIALRQPHLSPDQAMLAGLVHDIGVLPLCLHIEKNQAHIEEDKLEELIRKCSNTIGRKLLQKWNFPQDLIDVVGEHENLHRDSSDMPRADYTDVISIANLQEDRARAKVIAWDTIAAVKRLELSEEECRTFVELYAERIALIAEMLGVTPSKKLRVAGLVSPPSYLKKQEPAPIHVYARRSNSMKGILSSLLSLLSFRKR